MTEDHYVEYVNLQLNDENSINARHVALTGVEISEEIEISQGKDKE